MSLENGMEEQNSDGFSIRRAIERVIEIGLALVGFAIAGLTLWCCYYFLGNREEVQTPLLTILAIIYAMAFVAMALLIFSTRLLVPAFRLAGGRIIGIQGLWAFGILYGLLLLLALSQGLVEAQRGGLAIILGIVVAIALRSTFRKK